MSTTDYIVDILLIVVIFRQLRPSEVSVRTTILPIAIMVWAGLHYLHGFKVGGNDVLLIVLLTASGIALGTLSGVTTRVWDTTSGQVLARVGAAAIVFWVLGMGFRFAFAVYANSAGGNAAIGRFSAHHSITSGQAWTTALVLMAFGEVLARVGIMQFRRMRLETPDVALA
jgi:hypothetical protein